MSVASSTVEGMETSWDDDALVRVQEVTAALSECGIVDLTRSLVQEVWRANLERWEPKELGDTRRILGQTCAENLRVRMVREGLREEWASRGVRFGDSENSLLIEAAGVRVRLVKSPWRSGLRPKWSNDFSWNNASAVRRSAAENNAARYRPAVSGFGAAPLFPLEAMAGEGVGAAHCQEFFLVWAGEHQDGLTAGWLGLPSSMEAPWMAVDSLWMDAQAAMTGVDFDASATATAQVADVAEPQVRLKKQMDWKRGK